MKEELKDIWNYKVFPFLKGLEKKAKQQVKRVRKNYYKYRSERSYNLSQKLRGKYAKELEL